MYLMQVFSHKCKYIGTLKFYYKALFKIKYFFKIQINPPSLFDGVLGATPM